jgi:hypothetical protein
VAKSRDARERFAEGLAGALLLHAVVISSAYLATRATESFDRNRRDTSAPSQDDTWEVEYPGDLTTTKGAVAPPDPVEVPFDAKPMHASRIAIERESPASRDFTEPSEDAPYALDPRAERAPSARPQVDLGIEPGQWSRWVGQPPSAAKQAEEATVESILRTFEAHDRAIGLGPSGAIVSAFRDAASTGESPELSTATFTVTVLRSGEVDVELASASNDRAAWSTVAERVAAALRSKPPRISPPRNGVRLVLQVAAEERWSNGTIARSEGPSVAAEVPPIRSTAESKEELRRRNPAAASPPGAPAEQVPLAANTQPTGVFVSRRGKVCDYRLGIGMPPTTADGADANQRRPAAPGSGLDPMTGVAGAPDSARDPAGGKLRIGPLFTGGCDPSNAAAGATRVVSTRIVSETML